MTAPARTSEPPLIDQLPVRAVLDRLHRDARRDARRLVPHLPRAGVAWLRQGPAAARAALAPGLAGAYLAVSPAQGRFLYLLARALNARQIVEFGTSYGVSTLYLAAAVHDNFGGRVIGTEFDAGKQARALAHLREAGLARFAEVRLGDARETLARDLPASVDLVLLDGWKEQYGAVLDLLAPRLRPGAVVLSDNVFTFRRTLAPFVARLQGGEAGFHSSTLPFRSGLEFSVVA